MTPDTDLLFVFIFFSIKKNMSCGCRVNLSVHVRVWEASGGDRSDKPPTHLYLDVTGSIIHYICHGDTTFLEQINSYILKFFLSLYVYLNKNIM